MTKKTIHIQAIDTLFFKDGKPFSMGDEVWADGIFPPLPSVLYGALRSAFMFQKGISADEVIEQTKNFNITNIYLLMGNEKSGHEPVFPFPFDMVKFKDKNPVFLESAPCNNSSTNYAVLQSPEKDKAEDTHGKSVLDKISFSRYLKGLATDISCNSLANYMISEPKTGIGRDNFSRTTSGEAEGKMYRVGMQRLEMIDQREFKVLNSIKIAIEFEGLDLHERGILRLGGENKVAKYEKFDAADMSINQEFIHSNIVKIYLATPGVFENGWCPQIILQNQFKGISFKLHTWAIGKPIYAGGFDMKAQEPKFMFKAVPAGSVYYLQTTSTADAQKLAHELLQINSMNDSWSDSKYSEKVKAQTVEFEKQGFGKMYVCADKQK